jgi:hypothetical protein
MITNFCVYYIKYFGNNLGNKIIYEKKKSLSLRSQNLW